MIVVNSAMATRKKARIICVINACLSVSVLIFVSVLVVQAFRRINYRNPYILHTLSSQSEQLHTWLANGSLEYLQAGYPPVTVHYMWCQKGYFEFKHYVSILSIIKMLQPDQIVFHYTRLPLADTKGYTTWFEDLQRDVTFLTLNKDSNCGDVDALNTLSGIVINEDVAIINFSRLNFFKMAKHSLRQSKFRAYISPASVSKAAREKEADGVLVACGSVEDYNTASPLADTLPCVYMREELSPSDTWTKQGRYYTFVKSLVYGQKRLQPKSHYDAMIPLDCHILHFSDSDVFDYMTYASVMSALGVGGMKHVYLHSDRIQAGPLFDDVIQNPSVTFVHVPHIHNFHPTSADVMYGAYVLLRHGGVVVRSDTLWRTAFPKHLRAYDSTFPSIHKGINSSNDLTVLISQRNSEYLKLFISTLRQTPSKYPQANSQGVAYKVYIERPDSVNINTNLVQHVSCSSNLCEPTSSDEETNGSVFFQVSWNNGRPRSKSDVEQFREVGVSFLKDMSHY